MDEIGLAGARVTVTTLDSQPVAPLGGAGSPDFEGSHGDAGCRRAVGACIDDVSFRLEFV
jgi:hypothetical protein